MGVLDDEIAALQERLGQLTKMKKGGRGGDAGGAAQPQPLSLKDLIGSTISAPIPIGTPMAQGYAPGGPQLNFTGGSPFPVNNSAPVLHNAMDFAFRLQRELTNLRKQADARAKAEGPADASV